MLNDKLNNENINVCLVICPAWSVSRLPLGIAHIYSYLKSKGISAQLIDLNVQLFKSANTEVKELWELGKFEFWRDITKVEEMFLYFKEDVNSFLQLIEKNNYDVIGFSIFSSNSFFSYLIAKKIKAKFPHIKLVAGGPGVFTLGDIKSIDIKSFDFFITGEGEIASFDLCNAILSSKKEYKDFLIGASKENSKYCVINGNGKFIKNLDNLPFLELEKFNINDYTIKSIPLISSRGCIGKCIFCHGKKIFPPGYRVKSPVRLVQEIEYYINKYQLSNFTFNDLTINGNIANLEKFCDLLIKLRLNISWASYAMVRADMNEYLFRKFKLSGCSGLAFGVDSFSDNTLSKMKKNYTTEDIFRTLKYCKKAGITTIVNIIVGFPGESEADFCETLNNLGRCFHLIDRIGSINMCIVNQLSDLYINRQRYKLIINDSDPLGYHRWLTENNDNTYEIRKNRLDRLLAFINKNKINLDSNNELSAAD